MLIQIRQSLLTLDPANVASIATIFQCYEHISPSNVHPAASDWNRISSYAQIYPFDLHNFPNYSVSSYGRCRLTTLFSPYAHCACVHNGEKIKQNLHSIRILIRIAHWSIIFLIVIRLSPAQKYKYIKISCHNHRFQSSLVPFASLIIDLNVIIAQLWRWLWMNLQIDNLHLLSYIPMFLCTTYTNI